VVKGWLARAVARTAEHGAARSAVRRWIRWLPDRGEPGDPRFQGSGEPYPRHWRTPPAPWPTGIAAAPAIQARLRGAVRELPDLWRAVLLARDGARLPAERVAADLGLTVGRQRRILNRARAAVRDSLAEPLTPDGHR
jgi:RNA polymerase sigma-70 factor, ECF subfamily